MSPSKQPELVSLPIFSRDVDEALSNAQLPETSLEQSMDYARDVSRRLAAVEAGKIAVRPPLSQEQIAHYSASAATILTIGSKAQAGLERSESRRRFSLGRSKSPQSESQKPKQTIFKGTGSEAKR